VEYYPFGTYRYGVPPNEYATWDYDATYPNVDYTFTDQEYDGEADIGLYNFKARLYDPDIGRFISPDSVIPEPGNLQAFNRYSYCANNPLVYVDPSGHVIDWVVVGIILLAASFVYSVTSQVMAGERFGVALTKAFMITGAGMMAGGIGADIAVFCGAPAAGFVSNMSGAFAGGAAGGATSAGLNGGNILEGAIIGGLAAVAMAGIIYGIGQLIKWANGTTPTSASKAQTGSTAGETGDTTWPQGGVKFPEISPEMQTKMAMARDLHIDIQAEQCGTVDIDASGIESPREGTPVDARHCDVPIDKYDTKYNWHTHQRTAVPSDLDQNAFNNYSKGPTVVYGKNGITVMDLSTRSWNWYVIFDYY